MRKRTLLTIIVILVLVLSAYFFFMYAPSANNGDGEESSKQNLSQTASTTAESGEVEKTSETKIIGEDLMEYHNSSRNFSLAYPKGLSVTEYDEGDGTYTVVFENKADEKSFQLFFTPYLGDTITLSRIKKDVPSGQFTEPIEIVIGGGVHAITFFSTGPLGRMREVWFLYDGFLYEVTTYEDLDLWLSNIMQTWRFLN